MKRHQDRRVRPANPGKLLTCWLLLLLLAACADARSDAPVGEATIPADSELAESVADSIPPIITRTPDTTASPRPANDRPHDEGTPESAPIGTWPAKSDQTACGVLLPLLAEERPANDRLAPGNMREVVPESAQPAFDRLVEAPESVGLVAFEIGREAQGAFLNPDVPMPLASVVKIINLIAYAEAASAGELDPAEWIALDELERTFLPRSDLGAHSRAISELEERRLIAFDPPAIPLEEVPWMMIRHSSNAAADYLHLRLGQERIEQTILNLGLQSHTAPCPWIGQFLIMANRNTTGYNRSAVQAYIDDPGRYGRNVMLLAESYASDKDLRAEETNPGWRASFETQTLFSDKLNAHASARDYAGLMSSILQNELSSDYTNILVRRALEWPMVYQVNQDLFTTIGLKDGSLPGILTTAYYAQRVEDGAQVVVVLLYRQLPRETYRQWRRDLPHDEFARWLLADPSAIAGMQEILAPGT